MGINSNFNRTLSRIFTNPTFKSIVRSGESESVSVQLKKYQSLLSVEDAGVSIKDVLQKAYVYLSRNYRNEYIYKNTIANKILLGRHNLNTATLLSEFKVGGSIADLLLLNGTSTVYEIKTELDSPDKLKKQIDDYKKAFARIYLVVHHTLIDKYLQLVEDSAVGLLSLSSRFQLTTVKEAETNYDYLDNSVMMRCLRKGEYSSIIRKHYGTIPSVSNIKYFGACMKLAIDIDPVIFHSLQLNELKKRIPVEKECLQSDLLPPELKHICLCLNPTKFEYDNLFHFLNMLV